VVVVEEALLEPTKMVVVEVLVDSLRLPFRPAQTRKLFELDKEESVRHILQQTEVTLLP
jgi:hypothetical protein